MIWCSNLAISRSDFGSTRSIAWKIKPARYKFPEQPGITTILTMASRRMRGTSARIISHQRDVDNLVSTMGAKFTDLGNNYNNLYNEMLQHAVKDIMGKSTGKAILKPQMLGRALSRVLPYRNRRCISR
jgi:hypothetical protein